MVPLQLPVNFSVSGETTSATADQHEVVNNVDLEENTFSEDDAVPEDDVPIPEDDGDVNYEDIDEYPEDFDDEDLINGGLQDEEFVAAIDSINAAESANQPESSSKSVIAQ